MMPVLDRLILLGYDGPAETWHVPPLRRFRSVTLLRIVALGAGLSMAHSWRRIQGPMVEAITLSTPEMQWFREGAQ